MATFFFHGFGSCAEAFKQYWPATADDTNRFFLNGPERDSLTTKRRWFPLTARADLLARGVTRAADYAEIQIRDVLSSVRGQSEATLILKGHSQGAMVALELMRRLTFNVTAVDSYAGYLPPSMFDGARQSSNTRVTLHLYSSAADRFIKQHDVAQTATSFASNGNIIVRHHRSSFLPHEFSSAWLDATSFDLTGAGT